MPVLAGRVRQPTTHEGIDLLPEVAGCPTGHRCPGEPFTVLLLAATVRVLAAVEHPVTSSHDVHLARMPTMPEDGLLLEPRK